jgi:hypothetical protein
VIKVRMGIYYGIDLAEFFPESLLAEVGACINEDLAKGAFKVARTPRAVVSGIRRNASGAIAANHGNSYRG